MGGYFLCTPQYGGALALWDLSRLCNLRSRWTVQAFRMLQLGQKNKDQICTVKSAGSDVGQLMPVPVFLLLF